MATTGNGELVEISKTFYCKTCDYSTSRNYNLKLHFNSIKHKSNENATELAEISKSHICVNCNKVYNNRTGLWKHKKKCIPEKVVDTVVEPSDKELIMMLIKDNQELKTMMVEVIKNGTHNTTINNTNSNNNNTFNLNFFLNETCKDAMNLEDFIKSIEWRFADLEMVGDMGFAKGVSKLIIDKLNLLAENKRPIHCTDVKREVMYVRDDDKWEKEQEGNPTLRHAVKQVSHHTVVVPVLKEYRDQNPGCNMPDSSLSTKYGQIITEVICGVDEENEDVIIRNISKATTFDKGNHLL